MQRPLAGQNTEWFHCTMDVTGNSPNYQETSSRTPLKREHGWSTSTFLKRDCIVLMRSTVYLCECLCLSGGMSVLHVYIKLYYIIFCMLLYFDTLKNLSCWGETAPPFVVVQSLSYVWLWPHRLQHTRLPCPSPSPWVCSSHVHWVSDAIQPSHPLLSPFPPALNPFQHQVLFKGVGSSRQVAKVLEL